MNTELIQIMDILMDEPGQYPDLSAVSAVVAGSERPITLVQGLVYLLWLSAERPEEFDSEVVRLFNE